MTHRSPFRTPAVVSLFAVFVVSLVALQGVARLLADANKEVNDRMAVSADMTGAEMNQAWAWIGLGYTGVQMLGVLAAASALALVFVWCFWPRGVRPDGVTNDVQSSDGTRTMSAAGSTVNLADTTVPNSSPSISNSSAPSPISMSTERPRE